MPGKKEWAVLVCGVCGNQYSVMPYRAEISKCCSRPCAQRYAARIGVVREIAKRGTGTKSPYVKEKNRHQHRIFAEIKLGRPLKAGEIIHHIDFNSRNNHPDNLMVVTRSEHIKIHWPEMHAKRMANLAAKNAAAPV